MPLEAPATILGGLPVWAECWVTQGDGWTTDDDAGVDTLYWLKRDGTKGKPVSQKVYDKLEKGSDYWECDVCDQVFDYLAHEQWLREHPEGEDNVQFDGPGDCPSVAGPLGEGECPPPRGWQETQQPPQAVEAPLPVGAVPCRDP